MKEDEKTWDLIIIGAGPSALTAAIYAAREDMSTLMIEKGVIGGLMATIDNIENYPGFPNGIEGLTLAMDFQAQAEKFGAKVELAEVKKVERVIASVAKQSSEFDEVLDRHEDKSSSDDDGNEIFKITTDTGDFHARSVLVSTGNTYRKLGIPGEEQAHYCATCDGAFYRDKVVAVIGGGDAALEEAIFLTKFASHVYLVHRRQEFRAARVVIDRLECNSTIEPVLGYVPVEVLGDAAAGKVGGLRVKSVTEGSERILEVAGVFEFVGTAPISALVAHDLVAVDERGYIRADADGVTTLPGLFAAGDVTDGTLKQVVTAAGSGASAGFAALHYLESIL